MPELPDVELYVEHIGRRTIGKRLERIRLVSPFVLRTVDPAVDAFAGKQVVDVRRLGKRIVLGFEEDLFAVVHLMVAGRFQWLAPESKLAKKRTHCAFCFEHGWLQLTEAGTKKRSSLHLVRGEEGLADHHRGGLDVLSATTEEFNERFRARNHTLKRALTDPSILDGIGNAYSDEILWRAKLSPVKMSQKLDDETCARLHAACKDVLSEWVERLREDAADTFPKKVTAFRPEMAMHGKYGEPCPVCGDPVQRIVYASRETNYCPSCQTGGKLLADRGLSRLLKKDWPKSLEELEAFKAARRDATSS